jgi:hypothetical protein
MQITDMRGPKQNRRATFERNALGGGGSVMCPLREQCSFYLKFKPLKHPAIFKIIDQYCHHPENHLTCIHYEAQNSLEFCLDPFISPTGTIIPRPNE